MPRLPDIPIVQPQSGNLRSVSQAAAPLALGAQFVGEIADRFAEEQRKENEKIRTRMFTEKSAEMIRGFTDLSLQAEETDDVDGISRTFSDGATDVLTNILSSVNDDVVSEELTNFATEQLLNRQIAVDALQKKRQADKSLSAMPGELQAYRDAIAVSKTEEERMQLTMRAHEMVDLNPYMNEVAKVEMRSDWDRDIAMDDLERVRNERPGDLFNLLKDPEAFHEAYPVLTEGDRQEIFPKIRSQIGGKARADMKVRVSRAESQIELDVESDRADALREQQFITDGAWANIQLSIDRRRASLMKNVGDTTLYDATMAGPGIVPLDPGAKSTKDSLFAGYERDTKDMDPEEILAHEVLIVTNSGILPPQVLSRFSAVTTSGSPGAMEQEAEQAARIREASPAAYLQIPEQERMILEGISQAVKFDTPAEEALDTIRKQQSMSKDEKRIVKERLKFARDDTPDEEWLSEKLGIVGY